MSKVENCVLGAESDFRRVDKDLSSLEERVSKQPIHSLCGEEIVKRATWCSATFDLVHHCKYSAFWLSWWNKEKKVFLGNIK